MHYFSAIRSSRIPLLTRIKSTLASRFRTYDQHWKEAKSILPSAWMLTFKPSITNWKKFNAISLRLPPQLHQLKKRKAHFQSTVWPSRPKPNHKLTPSMRSTKSCTAKLWKTCTMFNASSSTSHHTVIIESNFQKIIFGEPLLVWPSNDLSTSRTIWLTYCLGINQIMGMRQNMFPTQQQLLQQANLARMQAQRQVAQPVSNLWI